MGEIIDLEEYREQLAVREIDELQKELDAVLQGLTPIFPEPYFPSLDDDEYLLSTPMAGSFGMMGACPCCGYGSTTWGSENEDKNES